jgi:hypothetical protein
MNNRRPGFLVRFGSWLLLSAPSPVKKLDRRHIGRREKGRQLADGRERGGEREGAISSTTAKKAWSSIVHSILSGWKYITGGMSRSPH